ncbi:hypothetical protein SPOG_04795 [Schizosaccharomyces cryophilus OY26]|uniref:NADP-dependent oxidoreductase domain-containing protein n=1 Tax=Schizosaccharomyces cryophilus (strain OY26 / ATCC MYA-4695 / CBS 11777 / NBRC 106824 / NRRL Y48691) TaxID=653667 RepID=S9VWV5_SCHCR|nr:uncharacterized protein SPOG_04795 [Schizosaccharomyces cryophilus OY26]EPY52138.1 hypothetical protein SPOG_04795 [Schizosaccharomyces cryophilus OY26]
MRYNLIAPIADQPSYNNIYGYGATIWSLLKFGIFTAKDAANLESPEGKKQIEQIRQVSKIAERSSATPAQLAIAWTLKSPHVSIPILVVSKSM